MKKENIGADSNQRFELLTKAIKVVTDLFTKAKSDIEKGRGKYSLRTLEALTKANENHLKSFADMVLGKVKEINFISDFFKRTTTLSIPKNENQFTITEKAVEGFWEPIRVREAERNSPTPSFDNDIWRWVKDVVILGIEFDFESTIYRFQKTLTHSQILEEAEEKGIKRVYTWLEALSIIREAILSGEVDVKNTGIIVYFKVAGNSTSCRFIAYRHGDGLLRVFVSRVDPGDGWRAGVGAAFCN